MDGNTGRGPGWQPGPQQAGPPGGWPPQQPQSGGWQQQPPGSGENKTPLPPVVLAGFGVIGVLAVLIVVVLVTDGGGSGDDGDPELSASDRTTTTAAPDEEPDIASEGDVAVDDPGAALGDEGPAPGDYTLPDRAGVVSGPVSDAADLDPPEIPSEADPPDYEESVMGGETDPMSGLPTVGSMRVDLEPEGYVDIPVHLEAGGPLIMMAYGDDGIGYELVIYDPAGDEIGTIEASVARDEFLGWEFDDPPIETAGTHVIRVIHHEGRDDGFVLTFYSADWVP